MFYKSAVICLVLTMGNMAYSQQAKIFTGSDLYFPENWTETTIITNRLGTGMSAAFPEFGTTTRTGASIQVNHTAATHKIILYKINPNTYVKDIKKRFCKIEQNKVYTINKKKYRAIGQTRQGVHFKALYKDKVFVVPAYIIKFKKSKKFKKQVKK